MVKMQKILGILLALCFLLSVTAGAASAYDGHGKEKYGHHAKEKYGHHAEFGNWNMVVIHNCFDSNCKCNDEDDNCNCNCNCEDDDSDEEDC